ncbi:MAG: SNF2-related protein, partial [Ferruginibacter sp.]
MALPHLIKHIYNNGTDEVIRRGKKIHGLGYVELVDHDELMSTITFRVKDDSYHTYYKVSIQKYTDDKLMALRCTCPYNMGEICRHEAAALFRLQDMVDKNLLLSSSIQHNQLHTVAKMKFLDLKMIRMLSSPEIMEEAEAALRTTKATINNAADERVEAELIYNDHKFPLVIQKNDERNFDTSCSCPEKQHPLCMHKTLLFLQLLDSYGPHYFDSIRNWDKEKNKLLQIYGYKLEDDLAGKFEFTYKDGKPFLKVLDSSIKRVAQTSSPTPFQRPMVTAALPEEVVEEKIEKILKLGIVINFNEKTYPGFSVDVLQGEPNSEKTAYINKAEKLDLTKFVETEGLDDEDKILFQQLRKLQESEVNKYLNRNSPFSGIWENIIHTDGEDLPDETKSLMTEYLHPKLRKIFQEQAENPFIFYLPKGKPFRNVNLVPLRIQPELIAPVFRVLAENSHYELGCMVRMMGQLIPVGENEAPSGLLFLHADTMYMWEKPEDVLQVEKFLKTGNPVLKKENWEEQMKKLVMPLTKDYQVEFDKSLVNEVKGSVPEVKLMLQEKGDYLLFLPVFTYEGYDAKTTDKSSITIPNGDKILVIHRNREVEEEFTKSLENLHSQFIRQEETGSLILKGIDVLRNNWFFLFIDAMKERKIPVYGFEALKNFRFNTARPNTHIHVSSGLDWFDAKVEIAFGEQRVGIADIKRAMSARQSFVQLGDGTLGILPDEWLKKYALLFKVSDGRADKLRLSKYHMSVIDELYENRNEEELSFALDEKYEKLKEYKNIPEIETPPELKDILRPYQVAGFQWLSYLNDVGWGGILADDMGLGKTVQALTMLDHYKTENGSLKTLVVCPTTLIYNWQNEVRKFTPNLTYHIHHGSARSRSAEVLQQHDIIITTYGTLRSDIQLLLKILFDYVVLDESQAIKNPASKVTKAATLLTAKNRICMSGTPLQNNTFDIFAQMNFLNPGLLGSMEFFRNEFATPIDKFGEQENKDHLRKLLYPFILRRTKEQVAKDLPDKTET